jgi:predicted porin
MNKKTLLALAACGAFCGAAHADGGNVQLYGTIDLGVTHFSGIGAGSTVTVASTGLSSGVQSPSVIGVKGMEPLGDGLAAVFQAETGFCAAGTNQGNAATQSGGYCAGGGFMQSQSWAGLKGTWGMIAGGRAYAAMYNNEKAMDPFGAGTTGSAENLSLINQYQLARANQTVAYVLPNLDGVTGSVSYSFAPGASGTVPALSPAYSTQIGRSEGVQLRYTAGALVVGIAAAELSNVRVAAFLDPHTGVNDGALRGWQVYGSYDLGVARLSAAYLQSGASYNPGHASSALLGATVPFGPGALLLSYNQASTDYGMRKVNLLGTSLYGTARQYALGYTYALSKRTDVYASYAKISNAATTEFAVGSATDSYTGAPGQGSTGVAIGMRFNF